MRSPDPLPLFDALAAIGRGAGGWNRPPWSDAVRAAEQVAIAAGVACGLDAHHDAAGNLWLTDPSAPRAGLVVSGSHLDTVPNGGAFDGALGVACALAAVAALREVAVPGFERLAVVSFADEEGWRFDTPIFGSRILTGGYGAGVLDRRDADGIRLGDVGPPDPLAAVGGHERIGAFVEVHIEQGVALAPAGAAVGIATGLAARGRYRFTVEGEANHAGTTPMLDRDDALVTAARFVLQADEQARARWGTVATIGQLIVEPGGSNVIPGRVTGTLDVRALDPSACNDLVARIAAAAPTVELDRLSWDPGATFVAWVRHALAAAAASAGVRTIDHASFAGHDAGVLAAAGIEAGMLFVRSPDGVSHNPAEHAEPDDCRAAAAVLAGALERLLG